MCVSSLYWGVIKPNSVQPWRASAIRGLEGIRIIKNNFLFILLLPHSRVSDVFADIVSAFIKI